jgi:hypothetical protein
MAFKKQLHMLAALIILGGISLGQTLTMVSPNDGGSFNIGEPMEIVWNAESTTNPFKITLWQNNSPAGLIADNVTAGNGRRTYNWERIGTLADRTALAGEGYKIKIKEKRSSASCISRTTFSLITGFQRMNPNTPTDASRSNRFPSVKVLSPNGGETLQRGGEYLLKWEAVENFGRPRIIIKKGNSIEMNIPPERVFATKTRAGWHLTWIISNEISGGGNYRFRVENSNGRLWDESDGPFKVEASDREITYAGPDNRIMFLTHQKVIRWRSKGISKFRIELKHRRGGQIIAEQVEGNSYTWVVGQLLNNLLQVDNRQSYHKILIRADDGGTLIRAESHSIDIKKPEMKVYIENHNTYIRRGERKTITWSTINLHGKVDLELWYEKGSGNWIRFTTLVKEAIKNGSYQWHIHSKPKPGKGSLDYLPPAIKRCKIRLVSVLVDYLYAESDYFYIQE